LILVVVVHAASLQDRDGAKLVLAKLVGRFPRLQRIWADGSYGGHLVGWAKRTGGWVLAIVKRVVCGNAIWCLNPCYAAARS
jgi:putative transposase